jgi:hypothetical protein
MKYDVEMGSGAIMHIPNLIIIGLAIQKLIARGYAGTEHGGSTSLLFFPKQGK